MEDWRRLAFCGIGHRSSANLGIVGRAGRRKRTRFCGLLFGSRLGRRLLQVNYFLRSHGKEPKFRESVFADHATLVEICVGNGPLRQPNFGSL